MRSDMDHAVVPATHTMALPAFPS